MVRRAVLAVAFAGAVITGCSGSPGPVGETGPIGPTGPSGETGTAGTSYDTGCPAPLVDGVCLLEWDNRQATSFVAAASRCALAGGDLCTDSQAYSLVASGVLTGPHWLSGYADNDGGLWASVNGGVAADHLATNLYGVACCGGATPPNPRVPVQTIANVAVTRVHNVADTTFAGAAAICSGLRSDVCTDSQTLLLRKAGALTVPSWTAFHADNDGPSLYDAITGGTPNDPSPTGDWGFACCASTRPLALDCPVARSGGVCAVVVHDAPDASFEAAAAACAARGADLCSTAQAAVLRNGGLLTVGVWTSSHSDNDNLRATIALGDMPDNPDLAAPAGYACCLN